MVKSDSRFPSPNPDADISVKNGSGDSHTVAPNKPDSDIIVSSIITPVGGVVSANSLVDMTVTNTPSFNLPMTGGVGTILFTLGGCALAVVGIAVVTGKRKKAE